MKNKVSPSAAAGKKLEKIARAAFCALALAAIPGWLPAGGHRPGALQAAETADNWIYLDGSGSSDDYGANLQYHWRQIGGTRVFLEDGNSAKPRFVPPTPGKYSFELIVSNGEASSKPAVVEIEVDRANTAPRAVLSPTLKLTLGENLVLDGSRSSDADNDQLTYHWRQLSGSALLSEVAARQSRNAPVISLKPATSGIYEFELTVSDGQENSAPSRCRVEVVRPVSVPVARVSAPRKTVMKFMVEGAKHPTAKTSPAPVAALPETVPAPDTSALEALINADAELPEITADKTVKTPEKTEPTKPSAAPAAEKTPALPVARISTSAPKAAVREVPALTVEEVKPAAPDATAQINSADDAARGLAEELSEANLDELTPISETTADITPVRAPQLRITPAPEPARPQIKMMPVRAEKADSQTASGKNAVETTADWGGHNVPPVAAVKGNVTAEIGQKVLLEGMGTDVDGDKITYHWRQTAGPVIPGKPENMRNIAFIPQEAGVYIFELTVNDGKADSDPAACAVTVIDSELDNLARTPAPAAPEKTKMAASSGKSGIDRMKFWK